MLCLSGSQWGSNRDALKMAVLGAYMLCQSGWVRKCCHNKQPPNLRWFGAARPGPKMREQPVSVISLLINSTWFLKRLPGSDTWHLCSDLIDESPATPNFKWVGKCNPAVCPEGEKE